jgi:hypothetical protein
MFGVSDAQLSQRSQIRRVLLTAAMQRVKLCQRFCGARTLATGLERTGCMTAWRGPHGPVGPRRYALRTLSRGTSTVLPSILTNMFAGFSGLRFTRATPGLSPSSATMTFS